MYRVCCTNIRTEGGLSVPREKDGFRDQLESIIKAFPDKECLTVSDVARYTGYSRNTVSKKYPFVEQGGSKSITRTILARCLVGGGTRQRSYVI